MLIPFCRNYPSTAVISPSRRATTPFRPPQDPNSTLRRPIPLAVTPAELLELLELLEVPEFVAVPDELELVPELLLLLSLVFVLFAFSGPVAEDVKFVVPSVGRAVEFALPVAPSVEFALPVGIAPSVELPAALPVSVELAATSEVAPVEARLVSASAFVEPSTAAGEVAPSAMEVCAEAMSLAAVATALVTPATDAAWFLNGRLFLRISSEERSRRQRKREGD